MPFRLRRTVLSLSLLQALLGLAACQQLPVMSRAAEPPIYQRERFQSAAPYWRAYPAEGTAVCEGVRQALLSQGYLVTGHSALALSARKFFRPEPGEGVELAIHVTCVNQPGDKPGGIAYVTAWQDHFVTKKNANAASLGVNAVGSISLPLSAADDALVKVGVEMIEDPAFFERLHALVGTTLQRQGLLPTPR